MPMGGICQAGPRAEIVTGGGGNQSCRHSGSLCRAFAGNLGLMTIGIASMIYAKETEGSSHDRPEPDSRASWPGDL
jgi:hypothetical protein